MVVPSPFHRPARSIFQLVFLAPPEQELGWQRVVRGQRGYAQQVHVRRHWHSCGLAGVSLWERKDSLSLIRFFKGFKTIFPTVIPTVNTMYSSFDDAPSVVSLVSLWEEVSTSGITSGLPSMAIQSAASCWFFQA